MGIVDGPLAFDSAVSRKRPLQAKEHSVSACHGKANILLVPGPRGRGVNAGEAAYLAWPVPMELALCWELEIPIMLTNRADDLRTRLASAAVAVLLAHAQRSSGKPLIGGGVTKGWDPSSPLFLAAPEPRQVMSQEKQA